MVSIIPAAIFIRTIAFVGGSILYVMTSANAYADVDIYNEDNVSFIVSVSHNGEKMSRTLAPGSSWKRVCIKCNVSVQSIGADHWHEAIEASGNDVVTIDEGVLHIATY